MILHGYVKQCKYKTILKIWFLLEDGRIHNVFDDKPAKWPIVKKIKNQSIQCTPTTNSYGKKFTFGDINPLAHTDPIIQCS
jgi:hypothetical protein